MVKMVDLCSIYFATKKKSQQKKKAKKCQNAKCRDCTQTGDLPDRADPVLGGQLFDDGFRIFAVHRVYNIKPGTYEDLKYICLINK